MKTKYFKSVISIKKKSHLFLATGCAFQLSDVPETTKLPTVNQLASMLTLTVLAASANLPQYVKPCLTTATLRIILHIS